jgi:hypothetical protein
MSSTTSTELEAAAQADSFVDAETGVDRRDSDVSEDLHRFLELAAAAIGTAKDDDERNALRAAAEYSYRARVARGEATPADELNLLRARWVSPGPEIAPDALHRTTVAPKPGRTARRHARTRQTRRVASRTAGGGPDGREPEPDPAAGLADSRTALLAAGGAS